MTNPTKTVGDKIGSWTVVAVVSSVARNDRYTTFTAICEKPDQTRAGKAIKRTRFDITAR